MTEEMLSELVDLAIKLDKEAAAMAERLKLVKAELIAEAKEHKPEHTKTEGGGRSWTAAGRNGDIARVTFPGKKLKGKISGEAALKKIRDATGKAFARLFQPVAGYNPVPEFRTVATQILGDDAKKVIKLCESKSSPTVSFEVKEGGAS